MFCPPFQVLLAVFVLAVILAARWAVTRRMARDMAEKLARAEALDRRSTHKGDLLRGLGRSSSFLGDDNANGGANGDGDGKPSGSSSPPVPRRRSRRASTVAAIDEQLGEKRTEVTRALLEVIPKARAVDITTIVSTLP